MGLSRRRQPTANPDTRRAVGCREQFVSGKSLLPLSC